MMELVKRGIKFIKKDPNSVMKRFTTRVFGILMELKFLRFFFSKFRSNQFPDSWIIILSNYNSGSTLLRNILASTSEISYLPNESVIYTSTIKRPDEEFGWQRNWIFCEKELRVDPNDYEKFKQYKRDISPVIIPKENAKYLLEKSISNVLRIAWFEKQCKNVKFVAIFRDPVASCEGMLRKAKPVGVALEKGGKKAYTIKDVALQYKLANEEIMRMSSQVRNIHMLKYEELCANPKETLRGLFEYLQLEENEFECFGQNVRVNGYNFELKDMNAKSYSKLHRDQIDEIKDINSDIIRRLGYA
jgi:hypothetical protein